MKISLLSANTKENGSKFKSGDILKVVGAQISACTAGRLDVAIVSHKQ